MSRQALFEREPVPGIGGLVGLTGPGAAERLGGVVDVVVLGAKSDGKTQFITHVVRTLEGREPPGLSAEEHAQNEQILSLVVNAKRPMPEANPDRKVRHYVFRLQAAKMLGGMGAWARLRAYLAGAGLAVYLFLALAGAAIALGGLLLVRGALDAPTIGGAGIAFLAGAALAGRAARRELATAGELEVVFWDVAGEDVYSDRGAGNYHALLQALVNARRARAREAPGGGRRYALAPALICNPLAVGTREEDSSYARLRMIMSTFAALNRPAATILAVVNRFRLVRAICGTGEGGVDDCIAVLPVARNLEAGALHTPLHSVEAPRDAIPVVRRSVVLRHCRDGDPSEEGQARFETIQYEAGLDAAVDETPWPGFDALPEDVRARFRPPAEEGAAIKVLCRYSYSEGPGTLDEETARRFFSWLGGLAYASDRPSEKDAAASEPAAEPATEAGPLPAPTGTVRMFAVDKNPTAGGQDNPGGFRSGGR